MNTAQRKAKYAMKTSHLFALIASALALAAACKQQTAPSPTDSMAVTEPANPAYVPQIERKTAVRHDASMAASLYAQQALEKRPLADYANAPAGDYLAGRFYNGIQSPTEVELAVLPPLSTDPVTVAERNRNATVVYAGIVMRTSDPKLLETVHYPEDDSSIVSFLYNTDRRICEEQYPEPISMDEMYQYCGLTDQNRQAVKAILEIRACAKAVIAANRPAIDELTAKFRQLQPWPVTDFDVTLPDAELIEFRNTLTRHLRARPALAPVAPAGAALAEWCK